VQWLRRVLRQRALPAGNGDQPPTHGRCSALVWHAPQQRYRCTLALLPGSAVPARWRWAARLKARLAQHFISAGAGCDSRATSHPL